MIQIFSLASYIPPNPGPIIDKTTGEVISRHSGLWNYTIGENARIPGMPMKMFVSQKDATSNTIFVVPGTDNTMLYCKTLHIPNFSWIWKESPPPEIDSEGGFRARVMHRYRMTDVPCTVHRYEYFVACDPVLANHLGIKQTSEWWECHNRLRRAREICISRSSRSVIRRDLVLRLWYHRANIIILMVLW